MSYSTKLSLHKILLIIFLSTIVFQTELFCQYEAGDIVENFTLEDMDGNAVNLYDYNGYAIFINFFAYW